MAPHAAWLAAACALLVCTTASGSEVTLSIVGTNDLHGRLFTDERGRGGLAVLGGYVDNLRAARAADGGGVLVLDAGDTFQGGIESNLSEGLMVVDAYNAIGYTALAIGNHDFDFGAADPRGPIAEWLPRLQRATADGDLRGALKAAAARAQFPFLAANIADSATGEPVRWPNVRPSTVVEVAGVRVGIMGMMTEGGLRQTLAAHADGLTALPLAATANAEARVLRERGAELVVLATHAGGWCGATADPHDLASCDDGAEIFRLARELPRGTLQAIVAGHSHGTVAHFVNGVPIISVPNFGVQFGRLDLRFDTAKRAVVGVQIYEPQRVCARIDPATGECVIAPAGVAAEYEGRGVTPSASVRAAIEPELARVRALRAELLGVTAATAIPRGTGLDGALGHLFADALLAAVPDADVALSYGAGRGGLRADLPSGELTFGDVYDAFPFDNRITRVELTAAQLARLLEAQLPQWIDTGRGLPGVAGFVATIECAGTERELRLLREPSGSPLAPGEPLTLAMASSTVGRFAAAAIAGEPSVVAVEAPILVRDAVAGWLFERGGRIAAADFTGRWQLPSQGASCGRP